MPTREEKLAAIEASRLPAPPPAAPRQSLRAWLFGSLAGRLLVVALAVKLVSAAVQALTPLPLPLRLVNGAASLILLASAVYVLWRGLVSVKRRLLWRVRRKLILSYVFIGFVPTLLVVAFFLFGGLLMFMNISAYLFRDGYDGLVQEMRVLARTIELELRQQGPAPRAIIERHVAENRTRYPDLSIELIPAAPARGGGELGPAFTAGPWWHADPPGAVPDWVQPDGFEGTLTCAPADAPDEPQLLIRAVAPPGDGGAYAVVVDLPINGQVVEHLRDVTGIRAGDLTVPNPGDGTVPLAGRPRGPAGQAETPAPAPRPVSAFSFERSVAVLEYVDWATGRSAVAYLSLSVRLSGLYERISAAQGMLRSHVSLGQLFLVVLVVVAVLFLIIEFVALVMGFALARSITSSVHDLFMGTERVRQGDFTHRIDIKTRDQLGELADSFNQMTSSIEDLLQQAAEKKRMEEELRIAREIQMSLLPSGPLAMPGLTVAAVCVAAREVGGDYYDFFTLGERRLALLIADVAGKGTSAALYMAELKGLLLSLSQIYQSPRQLLIEANRILAENLGSRSFITMTYAVVDLDARVMTYARAGHTPMIYVAAHGGGAQVLTPGGMVLGLRLPGAEQKFAALLEEQSVPLHAGDVFVLYTDGISEAMNVDSELFGESRLGQLVEEHGHLDSLELRERIIREVQAFVGTADQHDDMTMILLKIEDVDRLAVVSAQLSDAVSPGSPIMVPAGASLNAESL